MPGYFEGYKNGEFTGPLDICFDSNRLYVLDKLKRIQMFTKSGDFICQKELFKFNQINNNYLTKSNESGYYDYETLLENPISMRVLNNTMAVLNDNECIYIYDTDGYLNQVIKIDKINSFSLLNTCMLALIESGTLMKFEIDKNGFYKHVLNTTCKLDDISVDMCLFNQQIILASGLAPRLSAFPVFV